MTQADVLDRVRGLIAKHWNILTDQGRYLLVLARRTLEAEVQDAKQRSN